MKHVNLRFYYGATAQTFFGYKTYTVIIFYKNPTLDRVFLLKLTDFCVGVNIRLDQYKIVEKTTTNTVAKIQQVQRLTKKPNFATIMTC